MHFSPDHPSKVKREYIVESSKRSRLSAPINRAVYYDAERYKALPIIQGTCFRRVAKNRIEVFTSLIRALKSY